MIQQLEECSSQSQGATCSFPQRKSSSHIDHVVDSNLNSKQVRILQLSAAVKRKSSGENIDESRHNRFESSIERGNPFALSELPRTFVTLIMTIFASLYKYVCYREMIGTEQKEDMNQTNKNVHQSLDLIANPMTDAFKPDNPKNVLQVEPIGKESVLQKQLSDGLYLRSKAYLIASRPQLAKKVRDWLDGVIGMRDLRSQFGTFVVYVLISRSVIT